jgi:isopenicillin-N epimerase
MQHPSPAELKSHWGLDPEVAYLNHGSFGACPKAVLAELHRMQIELEREPVTFLSREASGRLQAARRSLGEFVGANPDELAYLPNVTVAINSVLRSLPLRPGDELIVSNHEYNASRNVLDYVAQKTQSRVVVVEIPFPIEGPEVAIERMREAITPRTRLAMVDHVTSATGLLMPLAELIALFHEHEVEVLVDGAHAPGMIPLDLEALAPDYYAANCHKWICSPKGAGFLYVRPELQAQVRPAVISHGANAGLVGNARFRAEFEWTGTRDITPWLCVPKAISYLDSLLPGGFGEVMTRNHDLVVEGRALIAAALGVELPCPDDMLGSLAALHLPESSGFEAEIATSALSLNPLQEALFDRYKIEVPVLSCPESGRAMLRISAQLYNELDDYERLARALRELLSLGV